MLSIVGVPGDVRNDEQPTFPAIQDPTIPAVPTSR
jgi:hypothetical protein